MITRMMITLRPRTIPPINEAASKLGCGGQGDVGTIVPFDVVISGVTEVITIAVDVLEVEGVGVGETVEITVVVSLPVDFPVVVGSSFAVEVIVGVGPGVVEVVSLPAKNNQTLA